MHSVWPFIASFLLRLLSISHKSVQGTTLLSEVLVVWWSEVLVAWWSDLLGDLNSGPAAVLVGGRRIVPCTAAFLPWGPDSALHMVHIWQNHILEKKTRATWAACGERF